MHLRGLIGTQRTAIHVEKDGVLKAELGYHPSFLGP